MAKDEREPERAIPSTTAVGRVAVLCVRGLGRGGAERLVFEEARYLSERGLAVEVWHQRGGEFVADLEAIGIPVYQIRPSDLRRHLRRVDDKYEQVTIHTHSPSFAATLRLAARRLRSVRFIHTEHNLTSSYRPATRLAHRVTARWVDQLFAVSDAVLRTAPRVSDRSVLVHVDLGSPRLQRCLGLPYRDAEPWRMICVASLTDKKNHRNLLNALDLLGGELRRPLETWIVGDGPLRENISEHAQQVASRHDSLSIEMLGVRDDIPELLGDCDLLILPSKSEGLPLILMEAMAASTPVVATAVGGVPELVEDGRTGFLVQSSSPTALAEAISAAFEDPHQRLCVSIAARRQIAELAQANWQDVYFASMTAP